MKPSHLKTPRSMNEAWGVDPRSLEVPPRYARPGGLLDAALAVVLGLALFAVWAWGMGVLW